jgi:hypothetical protein
MSKLQSQNAESSHPFLKDKKHIYNKLIDKNIVSVNAGYATFEFELHSNLVHDETKVDGLTEFDTRKIKLETSLSNYDARETIIHEIYHCMLEAAGLDEKNFDGHRMFLTNEQLVVCLSKQTMLIHRLNPGLMSLIYHG